VARGRDNRAPHALKLVRTVKPAKGYIGLIETSKGRMTGLIGHRVSSLVADYRPVSACGGQAAPAGVDIGKISYQPIPPI
jgi:hypothetical protein